MKFAVGYQQMEPHEESFVDMVRDYAAHVAEVYFPWVNQPSGRAALGGPGDWGAQTVLENDLLALRDMGVSLDLLYNANCYGGRAVSQSLRDEVLSLLAYLRQRVGGVQTVTTTSLAVARTVRRAFPDIEVRASVNMRIGTIQAMEYVAGLFDSFYVQRDFNRDLTHLRELAAWARAAGKRLCLLVNSGCLRFCPGQTFHDNLVAHEAEIDQTRNIEDWTPHVCWHCLADPRQRAAILKATWIRPEDLHHYEGLCDVVKLATRMHQRPRGVLHAYVNRRHRGNLLNLLEPGFGPLFAPRIIDNDAFPPDWFARTSSCGGRCHTCDYCDTVMRQVEVLPRQP